MYIDFAGQRVCRNIRCLTVEVAEEGLGHVRQSALVDWAEEADSLGGLPVSILKYLDVRSCLPREQGGFDQLQKLPEVEQIAAQGTRLPALETDERGPFGCRKAFNSEDENTE